MLEKQFYEISTILLQIVTWKLLAQQTVFVAVIIKKVKIIKPIESGHIQNTWPIFEKNVGKVKQAEQRVAPRSLIPLLFTINLHCTFLKLGCGVLALPYFIEDGVGVVKIWVTPRLKRFNEIEKYWSILKRPHLLHNRLEPRTFGTRLIQWPLEPAVMDSSPR